MYLTQFKFPNVKYNTNIDIIWKHWKSLFCNAFMFKRFNITFTFLQYYFIFKAKLIFLTDKGQVMGLLVIYHLCLPSNICKKNPCIPCLRTSIVETVLRETKVLFSRTLMLRLFWVVVLLMNSKTKQHVYVLNTMISLTVASQSFVL